MNEDNLRPDPDELLARIKAKEEKKKRGKLKIFLGYAPGVGKTYTMLEAARQRKKDTDIVIAYVETHGRIETDALLQGFEVIPRKQIGYRGIVLSEMDIDGVLKRHPQLALVDELAHENAPGSRHPKRYQDVEELLQAGIDIYTTLNVQHVESGRNLVAEITGVWVRETVPDSIIDIAAEIELVDLPPDELIKRLKDGKVYVPEKIATAIEKYFKISNLTALRELTMRTAARHVDEQTLAYMKTHAIQGTWPLSERLLLFIGINSVGSRLVRNARRLAYELGAEWFAVYVETSDSIRLTPEQREHIEDSLRLAGRLGAKTEILHGDSTVKEVTKYVKENNINKIIIAKPQSYLIQRTIGGSEIDKIIRGNERTDIYLVSSGIKTEKITKKSNKGVKAPKWQGYILGFALVVLATLLGQFLHDLFDPSTIAMSYLICVVLTSYLWGFGPSILVSAFGVLFFDFFHIPPYFTFAVGDLQYIFTFFALFLVGVLISFLASRVRQQRKIVAQQQRQTAALYALARDLSLSNDLVSYIRSILIRAKETFGHDPIIFLPDAKNEGILKPYSESAEERADENDLAAAIWSFQHQKAVGPGTDTLPNTRARYLPLVTARGSVGVIGLSIKDDDELTVEQERLLEAYADLAAVALESVLSGEKTIK